ncbi:hypothetical protein IV102_11830 [bacterium]|nr:hypothetical protein [bacterium]
MRFVAVLLVLLISFGWAQPAGEWKVTERFEVPMQGTWMHQPATQTFQARWKNGSAATLRLERFEPESVVITRYDDSGPTAGLRVRYEGRRQGPSVQGTVLWSWSDQVRRGTWSAVLPAEAEATAP